MANICFVNDDGVFVAFVDGGIYYSKSGTTLTEGDYLLLPDGQTFYIEKFGESVCSKISLITCAEGPIPIDSKIVKLQDFFSSD